MIITMMTGWSFCYAVLSSFLPSLLSISALSFTTRYLLLASQISTITALHQAIASIVMKLVVITKKANTGNSNASKQYSREPNSNIYTLLQKSTCIFVCCLCAIVPPVSNLIAFCLIRVIKTSMIEEVDTDSGKDLGGVLINFVTYLIRLLSQQKFYTLSSRSSSAVTATRDHILAATVLIELFVTASMCLLSMLVYRIPTSSTTVAPMATNPAAVATTNKKKRH